MGYEFRVLVDLPTVEDGLHILRRASGGIGRVIGPQSFEYRSPDNSGAMPDITASIEPYGIYVCLNSKHGVASEVLGFIVASAASHGIVRVQEYE